MNQKLSTPMVIAIFAVVLIGLAVFFLRKGGGGENADIDMKAAEKIQREQRQKMINSPSQNSYSGGK
jgi:hypothetical protein